MRKRIVAELLKAGPQESADHLRDELNNKYCN
jgi:hypothetical protein